MVLIVASGPRLWRWDETAVPARVVEVAVCSR